MRSSAYGERDYAFGQAILTLRTTIGLTQAGLANELGVSRRAVGEWEAGSNYPKAEHLKKLIALGIRSQAFPAGYEAEEIRVLWKAAHQKVLLDEHWLSSLLAGSKNNQTTAAEQDGRNQDTTRHMERAFTTLQGRGVKNDTTRDVQLLECFVQEVLTDRIEEFLMHLLRGLQIYLDTADPQAAADYWEEVLHVSAATQTHIRLVAHMLHQQGRAREREACR